MLLNLCRWLLSGTISETRLRWDKSLQRLMTQRLTTMKVSAATIRLSGATAALSRLQKHSFAADLAFSA